jgi:hypothetical protein
MKPVCPHCKTQLTPFSFEGYYDEFVGWFCRCSEIPGAVKITGHYIGDTDSVYWKVMQSDE